MQRYTDQIYETSFIRQALSYWGQSIALSFNQTDLEHTVPFFFSLWFFWPSHALTFLKCTWIHCAPNHTHAHTLWCDFLLQFSVSYTHAHTHTHTPWKRPYRQTLMRPQTPLINTNSSPQPPPKSTLSYPPLIPADTPSPPFFLPLSILLGQQWLLGRTGSCCNWFRHNLLPTW